MILYNTVARCTVARLMAVEGLQGVVRGRRVQTTRPDPTVDDTRDLVQRAFVAERPNQLWVADFTYVATWRGMVYVAVVIDVFSRRIVGWRAHTTMKTALVLDALEQALYDRVLEGAPGALVVHSDRGSQYVAMRYTECLAEAGAAPSVGSVGDVYDNALAESVIGWYKTEVIRRRGPWRTFDDVEFATLKWVAWFNTQRLLEPLGYVPPRGVRGDVSRDPHRPHRGGGTQLTQPPRNPGRFTGPVLLRPRRNRACGRHEVVWQPSQSDVAALYGCGSRIASNRSRVRCWNTPPGRA